MKKQRNLNFAHLGNGISIYDSNTMSGGDYKKIAHIDVDRNITYYVKRLETKYRNEIEDYAETANPKISATQDQNVFREVV